VGAAAGKITLDAPSDSEFLFDLSSFTYYVDVQLIRTTATANPGLMSLQICPLIAVRYNPLHGAGAEVGAGACTWNPRWTPKTGN
jgi:hypothetical protein